MTIRQFEFKVKITIDDRKHTQGGPDYSNMGASDLHEILDEEWNDGVEVERLGYQVVSK